MKKILVLLMTLIMIFGVSAQAAETGNDFTIAYNGIVTLNPIMSQSSNDHNIFYLTQLQLIRYYGSNIQMDGAESYDVSDDATQYTFNLRDGLKWSDGMDLTAYDFEYTMKCILDPTAGSPAAGSWYAIKNAEAYSSGEGLSWEDVGVKALDDKTLQFTLEYPLATFDATIARKHIYPLRQDFVESVGTETLGSSVDNMLYSGAYVMTDWVLESSMDLEKNDLYWDAANSFPTKYLHFLEIEDPNTEVAMFENGEVDAIEIISSQYYDYLSDYQYKTEGGGFMFLWMNQNGNTEETGRILSNVNFRQALSYGFNREATCNAVNPATAAATRLVDPSFAGPGGGTFVEEYPINSVPATGDVEMAKTYLATALEELGYAAASELPEMKLVTWESTEQKLLGETIIDQWKQNLGITSIQLNQYVIGTTIGTFFDLTYDIFLITWESDVLPTDIMESMMTGGECNVGIWSDPAFDTLVEEAVLELDPVKKAELTQQAEQIFMDDAGIIPVYLKGDINAVKDYVEGFQISAADGFEFNHMVVYK